MERYNTIDLYILDMNAHNLHQAQGTSFTVISLESLIGKDSFVFFSQELLNCTMKIDQLNIYPTIQQNLK